MSDERGYVSVRALEIEWGHCDAAGIVFNPRFFEYFDWSTAVLLQHALGMSVQEIIRQFDAGFPLVETKATFHAPGRFSDRIEIRSTVVEIGRSSFVVEHELTRDGLLLVEGREKRVWISAKSVFEGKSRSQPIPDAIKAILRTPGAG